MANQQEYIREAKPGMSPSRPVGVFVPAGAQRAAGAMDRDDVAASAAWFETVYRDAAGDPGQVRWADGRPNPMLVSWLNSALAIVRPGARAVVVGCGLGDDVAELLSRGYDAVGFDVSPTAVQWARERFPEHADAFLCADLFNLPARFRRRFDLVVEIYTLQSLHPTLREEAGAAVAELVSGHGVLLTICRARKDSTLLESVAGPPWPLCVAELTGLMEAAGLHPLRAPEEFMDDESPPVERLRCAFCRA